MKKFNKKFVNVMATAALVASVAAPFSAFADSDNVVTSVPAIADDFESEETTAGSGDYGKPVSSLLIKEDNVSFTKDQVFKITLPSGVKFVKDAYKAENADLVTYLKGATVETVTDSTVELKITVDTDNDLGDSIEFPFYIKVDGATGELKATVEPNDTTLTGGTYTFARVGSGNTTASIDEVKNVGESSSAIGVIRIDENSVKAVGGDTQKVTLKLPSKFNWEAATVKFSSAFGMKATAEAKAEDVNADGEWFATFSDNNLEITFNPTDNRDQRGTIYIEGAKISADNNASFGDVEVSVDGDEIESQDFVVAKYADYAVSVTADGDVKEIVAGLYDDNDDLEATKLKIKEAVAGSIFTGRKTTVKFPSWVKIKNYNFKDHSEATITSSLNDDRNELEFTITALTGKADFTIEFDLSVQADKSGDIEAEVSGRAGIEGKVVLAKAVAPVKVETTPANVVVGKTEQVLNDIIITEAKKGAIKNGKLTIALPETVKFEDKPKVEVVEGNIDLDDKVELVDDASGNSDRVLQIKVDSESTKPSKIKISGATITLDRTVPTGVIKAKVGGDFIENEIATEDKTQAKFEDKDYAVEAVIANVVTPAPGEVSKEVKFVIDSTKYTVNGVEKTADVAPFIKDARTFLPIRFVAEAVGVTESNIVWNANTKTVTLIKGDRIAQVQVGSKNLIINGVAVQMDTAAFVKDGRVVLPLSFVAKALGADVKWDEATRTVTIN